MTAPRSHRLRNILLGTVAVLVVLVVAGVLVLDQVINSVARKETARLSQELQRPIALEKVATRFWGGMGVKVSGLSIGPGPGEGVPLLELARAEVSVALLRAIFSGGREIAVREAVVHGLRVNVEKLPDGETNLEKLAKRLQASKGEGAAPSPGPGAAAEKPGKPVALEVGRAALEEARIAFIDRTRPGSKELFVDHLDAEVRDLAVGKPLELVVKAAVLAERQNLELRVKAAPLPASLQATPEQVTLKVEPIDLSPLAPFLPRSVGLQGGRFQADLTVALGAAVVGGKGPTKLTGGFKATQLAFAGQAGGKRLDASLDADLDADAKAGDLDLRKLALAIGPATLVGRGRATGILGEAPKVEGLEVTSHGLDPALLAEYYPPIRAQLGGMVIAGPVGLDLRGQGTAQSQRLELKVDLTPVRLEVPHQLAKAAGAPLTFSARVDAAKGGGRIGLDADLDLAGADLRPGGTLAKKPGDPLAVKLTAEVERSGKGLKVALSRLAVNLLGDALAGKGELALSGEGKQRTTRFDAELAGERLDLDRLLLAGPAEQKPVPKEATKPAQAGNPFAGLSGEARLRLGLLRMKKVEAREVRLRVKVQEDAVSLEEAKLQAFGGSVDASGTAAKLAHPEEPFKVAARLKGISAEAAQALFTEKKVISGALDADLQLTGAGTSRAAIEKSLNGKLEGVLRDGAFHGKDLVAGVAGPLAGKLPFAKKVTEGGSTSLGKELPFSLKIADGMARLEKPLSFETGQGKVELGGGARLDGTLEMPATVALAPDVIAKLSGGKVKPDAQVPFTFRLVGPASSPRLEGLSVDAAAKSLAAQAATGALGKLLGGGGSKDEAGKADAGKADPAKKLEEAAKKGLKGLFGK
jgi:AsmA protein